MSKKRKYQKQQWTPQDQDKEKDIQEADHFATRERANDFVRLMKMLPDPDPILRKMGKGITALKDLLTDSHLESVWNIRCSAVSGSEWFIKSGADDPRSVAAAEAFEAELRRLDIPRIIEEMMLCVSYGYAPLEILWTPRGSLWGFDIVGKPPEWFDFTPDNDLVFKTGLSSHEALPKNRFLLLQHRASYDNPHGVKVFSKCFWPATFKKNGFRWWTVFVEKYGGAFMYGKYPPNAGEKFKADLLNALEKMIADAVAIAPEGSEITIDSVANKGGLSSVHKEYIDSANAEMSKAVLGQTLTTEIGDKGSYAAANTHNLVRGDLGLADRRRISGGFAQLSSLYALYNFGPDVAPAEFCFVKDEDLQVPRAERDVKLFAIGVRPKKSYITREYGIPDEDFDIVDTTMPGGFFTQSHGQSLPDTAGSKPSTHGTKKKAVSFFRKFLASRAAKKAEKGYTKDTALMDTFANTLLQDEQKDTNADIESLINALGQAGDYTNAFDALLNTDLSKRKGRQVERMENARYVASQLGVRRG